MFSLHKTSDSSPVARIKGGPHNNHLVYVIPPRFAAESGSTKKVVSFQGKGSVDIDFSDGDSDSTDNLQASPSDIISETEMRKLYRGRKPLKPSDINTIYKLLPSKNQSEAHLKKNLHDSFLTLYYKLFQIYEDRKNKEFHLKNGTLSPWPMKSDTQRDSIFISGPAGSGKSTITGEYIKNFKKVYPRRKVLIVSSVNNDPALDRFEPARIKLTPENFSSDSDDPITLEEVENCLIVFDDIDTISDKSVLRGVREFRDKCLEIGRHHNITVISISHMSCNYNTTRYSLLESNKIVIFPHSGSAQQYKRLLKAYCGLEPVDIQRILSLPSRWVLIHKHFPKYILYQGGGILL